MFVWFIVRERSVRSTERMFGVGVERESERGFGECHGSCVTSRRSCQRVHC